MGAVSQSHLGGCLGSWRQDQRRDLGEWVIGERGIVQDGGVYDSNFHLQQDGINDLIALIIVVRHARNMHTVSPKQYQWSIFIAKPMRFVPLEKGGSSSGHAIQNENVRMSIYCTCRKHGSQKCR